MTTPQTDAQLGAALLAGRRSLSGKLVPSPWHERIAEQQGPMLFDPAIMREAVARCREVDRRRAEARGGAL